MREKSMSAKAKEKTDRTNDLYARGIPAAKTIEEIKHLAAVRNTTVGVIVHREHSLVRALREIARANLGLLSMDELRALLVKHGLDDRTG